MAYRWANRAGKVVWQFVPVRPCATRETGNCCKVSKRQMFLTGAIALAVLLLLAVAWLDGGREEQRMIVEPVALPEKTL